MIVLDSQLDLFEYYDIDCIFECMFLATLPANGKRGIGYWLTHFSYEFAKKIAQNEYLDLVSDEVRNSDKRPQLFSAIFTSAFSQNIGRKLNFTEHSELRYDDLFFKGIPYSRRINNAMHSSAVVMSKKLN